MIATIAASLVFAGLFVLYALVGAQQSQEGCHGCAGEQDPEKCGAECPLMHDAERRALESNVH